MKHILSLAIAALALTFIACGNKSSNDENSQAKTETNTSLSTNSAVGKAPNFMLTSIDNKGIELSKFQGKVVIVDFWATWCPPCRKGIPDLIDIQKTYGNDVVVIGISVDSDTKNDVVPFVKDNSINYLIAYATPEVVQAYGGIESIPTSFVIDQKGNIVDQHIGLVEKSDYTNVINKLLNR